MNELKTRNFKNVKLLPLELSRLFSQDEKIQRLVVLDSSDALTRDFSPLSFKQLMDEKYFSIVPLTETGIKEIGRNTFIVINALTDTALEETDGNNIFSGSIFICSDLDHLVLDNYQLRLVELQERIVDLINKEKFSCSGALQVLSSTTISYSTYLFGYRIDFNITDQPSKGAVL